MLREEDDLRQGVPREKTWEMSEGRETEVGPEMPDEEVRRGGWNRGTTGTRMR